MPSSLPRQKTCVIPRTPLARSCAKIASCKNVMNATYIRRHSHPQSPRSFWSAPGIETSGRLRFRVCESRTSGRSVQSRIFFNGGDGGLMVDQSRIDVFHEALNSRIESLGLGNISLKEKQYEVLLLLHKSTPQERCVGGIAYRLWQIVDLPTSATGSREEFYGHCYFASECPNS